MSKFKKLTTLAVADIIILIGSYVMGALLNFGTGDFSTNIPNALISAAILIGIYLVSTLFARSNDVIWRYSTERDQIGIFCVMCLVGAIFFGINYFGGFVDADLDYFVLSTLMSAIGTTVARVFYKLIARWIHRGGGNRAVKDQGKRLVVVGAGLSGTTIVEDAVNDVRCALVPVAIVDDDPQKQGRKIHNVKVAGKVADIVKVCKDYDAQMIYVAIPSATNHERSIIISECAKTNLPVKILPYYTEFADSDSTFIDKVRDITPEELLGREPINIADEGIYDFLSGKTVAVTGGGGSIGSELCRQIAEQSPKKLIIIDIYENNAYSIQQELIRKYGSNLNLQVYIASVRDREKIDYLFSVEKPDVVFHAAAHKHVPLMEVSPDEAVKNNIFGTYNTALAAKNNGVKRFILISTDKAVNPTNCMGASKRVCEMVIEYFNSISEGATTYAAVRFGNVLGSNGSVIPLFKQQIESRVDLTVTHPDIIRYFMTIPEASQLVLTAGSMAKGGEIFILDMGEPVKINDLAKKMIRLSGLVEGRDIKIRYTGLRPGEKLFEELLVGEEGLKKTLNSKIFTSDIKQVNFDEFKNQLDMLKKLVSSPGVSADEVADALKQVVPTFKRYVPEKTFK